MMVCSLLSAVTPTLLESSVHRHLSQGVVRHDLVTRPSSTGESRSELTVALAGGRPATDW
jgi:hypothetical protein